ncbi:hypothetical protein [Yoonia sp. SS1-5]|uniref:YfaP family protein n=1 Tax=Yoonia rhodophyticola TaxID=3137370 RepID=A0AAN0NLF7_9RHOB
MTTPRRIAITGTDGLLVLGSAGQRSYEMISATIGRSLSDAHVNLFAEPVASDNGELTDWYSSLPGETMALSDLPDADQQLVEDKLSTLMDDIRGLAAEMRASKDAATQRLAEALDNAVKIPGPKSVFVIAGTTEDGTRDLQPVLVDWASVAESTAATNSAGLVAWTPRRRPVAPPPSPAPAPPVAETVTPVVQPVPVAVDDRRQRYWIGGLLSLLLALLTGAVLWLLLPACGVALFGGNFCPAESTVAEIRDADTLGTLSRDRAVLENRVALLERELQNVQNACAPLPPEPEPEPTPPEEPQDEIDERLEREDASSGDLDFALVWDSQADLDLHVTCPSGETIYYGRSSACGGTLDVDMNARGVRSDDPVEHIYFVDPAGGTYKIKVVFYNATSFGGTHDFTVRIAFGDRQEVFRGSVSQSRTTWTQDYVYTE